MQKIYNFLKIKLCYRTYWKQWLALLTICFLVFACSDDEPCDTSPSFSSVTSSNISYTSLSLSGTISASDCDSNLVTQGIAYSTSELPSQSNSTIVFSDESYNLEVTGLATSTTYYFRPFFVNQDGVFYGNQISVTTLSTDIEFSNIEYTPYITTVDASGNYSFLQGQGVNVINKGVKVLSNSYDDNESPDGVISLEGIGSLIADSPATFQLYVTTEFGTTFSESIGFYTTSTNSEVSTTDVTDIDFTSASLSATYENTYNGDDLTTEKGFEISLNENFNNSSIMSASSSEELTISFDLSNLNASTQYYVKAFVTNEYGTNYGAVNSFSTSDAGSEFTTVIISEIGFDTATFSSSYENLYEGEDLTYERGFIIADNPDFYSAQTLNSDENGLDINYSASNLELNTTYYVKAFVTNQYGTTYSESISFETLELEYSYSYTVNDYGYDFIDMNINYSQVAGDNVEISSKGVIVDNGTGNPQTWGDDFGGDGVIEYSPSEGINHNTTYTLTGFIITEFGTYNFEESTIVITPDATPDVSSSVSTSFGSANFTVDITNAPDTTNSMVFLDLLNSNGQIIDDYALDSELNSQSIEISGLNPATEYNYLIKVINEYGIFDSEINSFFTVNDEPNIDFSYELTGENQISLTAEINPAEGDDTIDSILLRYKHHEQDNYSTINLDSSNYSILEVLDDLVQGPNYNFRLVVSNEWNTFESDLYYNLPVTYEVGDYMFGGIITFIDGSGYHGLVMSEATYAIQNNIRFSSDSSSSDDLNLALNDLNQMNDGAINTQIILEFGNSSAATFPAAEYCDGLNVNGYDDWYLGSAFEYNSSLGNLWGALGTNVSNWMPVWSSNLPAINTSSMTYEESLQRATDVSYNGCNQNWGNPYSTSNQTCVGSRPKDLLQSSVWPMRKF